MSSKSLRSRVIRLASANPELRPHLLGLLKPQPFRRAGMFDYPGNLFDEVAAWLEGLNFNPGGSGWKKYTKNFPLTEEILGNWRYLDRVKELVGEVNRFLKGIYPLKVNLVFDAKGKKGNGDWSPVGNTLNLYSRSQWLPETVGSTLEHELRHFSQYLFENRICTVRLGLFLSQETGR